MAPHDLEVPLSVTHPLLAEQLLPPYDPELLTQRSDCVVTWLGPLGHVWQSTVAERVQGRGCSVCSSLQPPSRKGSVQQADPQAAAQADGWDPAQVSAGSRVEMPWRCRDCGTRWIAEICARANGHRPCPTCTRTAKPPLSVTHPGLAAQMLPPHDPDTLTHGSKAKVRWRGPIGHEWEATVANRVKGSGCPVCSHGAGARARRTPLPGASLADLFPDVAAEADGWEPSHYRAKSNARLSWRCSACGHQWSATIYSRTQRTGCPACARDRRHCAVEGDGGDAGCPPSRPVR